MIDPANTIAPLTWRVLSADAAHDVSALQRVLEGAPAFSLQVEGRLPPADAAAAEFAELPPNGRAEDKTIIAFSVAGDTVGCAVLLRGYPDADIAYLGLIVFIETHQRQRLGRRAMQIIDTIAADWRCTRLRLAVIATNTIGHAYWQRDGFVELYRKVSPQFVAEAIVMQRDVRSASTDAALPPT